MANTPVRFGRTPRSGGAPSDTRGSPIETTRRVDPTCRAFSCDDAVVQPQNEGPTIAPASPEESSFEQPQDLDRNAAPRSMSALFGRKYVTVQIAEADDEEAVALRHEFIVKGLLRKNLLPSLHTCTLRRPAIMGLTVLAVVVCSTIVVLYISTHAVSLLPEEAPSPSQESQLYVATSGFTCKTDESILNVLTESGLPPSGTSREAVPCWSEAEALFIAKAVHRCSFMIEEVQDSLGRSCIAEVNFCEEPIAIKPAESTERTSVVSCQDLAMEPL